MFTIQMRLMNQPLLIRTLIFALAISTMLAPAVGAERITLAEAMAYARSNAPEIGAAEARADASEARLRQARSYRLPSVALQEVWMRTDSPAEAFALQLNQERFSFPDFVSSNPNDPQAIESATTRLLASMPIYTGGEISGRIQQAELASQAAKESASWKGNEAAFAAAEAYLHLAQAREHVALLERALETVEAHVRTAGAYAEQGMLVRSELLRAEVEQARIEDLLTEARGRDRVAAANLSFRVGIAPTGGWHLAPLPAPQPHKVSLADWLQLADSRNDLAAARLLLSAGELEAQVLRSGLRPKVGLVARHDLVDDTLFGSHGDSTSIMAVGSIDLWTGGRHRAAARAAELEAEAARREIGQFAEGIALDIENAYEQEKSALERHQTAVRAQKAAAEAERITIERFDQGVVKTIDVLDASTARREAEMRELIARSDAHLSRLRLALKAGQEPEDVAPPADNFQSPDTAPNEGH